MADDESPFEEMWKLRERLAQATARYLEYREVEHREDYLLALKAFSNIVLRKQAPPDEKS